MKISAEVPVKVGVLVINQNNKRDVAGLLKSLESVLWEEMEVLLMDNNCSPSQKSKQLVDKSRLSIRREVVAETLSESAAYNMLIDKAMLAGCDWVWLVDSRYRVLAEAVKVLSQGLADNQVGLVGGGVKTSRGMEAGGGGVGWASFRLFDRYDETEVGGWWQPVDWVRIENLLVRAKAIEKVGRFTTNFFHGYEDMDWGIRIKASRWKGKVWTKPLVRETSKLKLTPLRAYCWGRNPWLIIARHFGGGAKVGRYLGYTLINVPVNWLGLMRLDRGRELAQAYLTGVVDGWRLVSGGKG